MRNKRLLWIFLTLLFLFSTLIAHFFKLQVIEGDTWEREGRKQHYFFVRDIFQRGTFFSNTSMKKAHPENSKPLVFNVQKFHLFGDPDSIPEENKEIISSKLSSFLALVPSDAKALQENLYIKSRSRKLAVWLNGSQKEEILKWWIPYASEEGIPKNALFFVSDYLRSYPYGKLLGQVLHTVQLNKDETTQEAHPTGGLELYFNKFLQGKLGKRRLMRSPRNALEIGDVIVKPQDGADIYLTINHVLQAICEEELEKGVKKSKAKAGWAVMMHPRTGEIFALAQYPFFFPSDYTEYFNDPLKIEDTKVKAITDANEPGSIMKPLTFAVALLANDELKKRGEKPLFDPLAKMPSDNPRFPGRSKPLPDTHLHHFLNLDMATSKSSNIYPARLVEKIIERLGENWYRKTLQEVFGIGVKTHIELPAESAGVLPTPGKKHPNGKLEWSVPTPFSMAIGHNLQVTSLQILTAYTPFANGGIRVLPTLIKKIVKKNERGETIVLFDNTSEERLQSFKKVLDISIVNQIVHAMKFVTKVGGTSRRADVPGYTEAGKTGTANKIKNGTYVDCYVSSFVGFTPVNDPAFILVVTMDEPWYGYIPGVGKNHMGGTCSAPVFREIAKRSLDYLGIPPDDPHGYSVGDPRYDPELADWVKENRKLQEMYEKWNK